MFLSLSKTSAFLEFARVNVSGYAEVPDGFKDGDIDLDALQKVNPGIGRPNLSFVLVARTPVLPRLLTILPMAIDRRFSIPASSA